MYQFSVFESTAKFHCKMKIEKCKMQILGRKSIQFSFFNLIFAICNTF